ncbi:ferrous iron transporter B [Komagataeibacter saccharivorans]|uniref:ferrous iron transporter B n=1 Tax=Komagataeibacter saccharivorans TaxID=265959 RepID=UPI000C831523|nr:ferrous iron transporter B [Komagataeibacter saccharivorans]PYD50036.1 ferrous iron transporter B [Komagataeibacter saccharivorans]GBQ36207.1 ferrous iron transport protein B [Komagataeibacter saccharivorans NRIC 0614]
MTTLNIALVGNPNCGKTALFNLLTGSRQKVANYAGATVERKEGWFTTPGGRRIRLLDLPGAYSLNATSPDEAVTRDVCAGTYRGEAAPDLLVCVADATNLRLHLRFVLEMRAMGRPLVLALNMIDAARRNGMEIDLPRLQAELGMVVIPTIGVRRDGARELLAELDGTPPPVPAPLPEGTDLHALVRQILSDCVTQSSPLSDRIEERLDRWVLHPVWGPVILIVLLFFMFQAVFAWAQPLMDAIDAGMGMLGQKIGMLMPDGVLRSLIVDGVIAGAGSVVTFLPQILILFAWILVLEESGYLPRAAFLLDRLMSFAGLSGRSFIPLLSSFACAVPGIMSTRTIQNPRDRLVTILIAPLMTCSARLPVYTLLIGAFIPHRNIAHFLNLQGLVLFGLYAVAIASALVVARVLRWRNADRQEATLLMELPAYRVPNPRDLALGLWERARIFLLRVGTTIVSLTVMLWGLSSFPAPPAGAQGPAIDWSFAGRIGHLMLPVFAPLGFNWQICVALIPGLAAREVAVGALATVYSLGSGTDTDQAALQLGQMLPTHWGVPTALSLLAWYVYAPQCVATLAVIRRETASWRVVAIAAGYLFALAYAASFLTYHIARMF